MSVVNFSESSDNDEGPSFLQSLENSAAQPMGTRTQKKNHNINTRKNSQSCSDEQEQVQEKEKRSQRHFIKKTQHNSQNQKQQKANVGSMQNIKAGTNKRKAQNKIEETEKQQNKKVNVSNNNNNHSINNINNISAIYLYQPGEKLPDLTGQQLIEIRIPVEYINILNNNQLGQRNIWGNDQQYTSDSDAVCILIHSGFIDLKFSNPELNTHKAVSLLCKVIKSKKTHASVSKYGLLSRSSKNYQGHGLKPESFSWLEDIGTQDELISCAKQMATWQTSKRVKKTQPHPNPRYLQTIPEINLVFNLNNEPAYKYSCINICDKGNDTKTWKSYRLKDYVMYIDTSKNERFEISRVDSQQQKDDEDNLFSDLDQYRLAKVSNPFEIDNHVMQRIQIPMQKDYIEVIFEELDWSDFLWGSTMITVKNTKIEGILSYKYFLRSDSNAVQIQ